MGEALAPADTGYFFQWPGFSPDAYRLRDPHSRHICSSAIGTVLTSCVQPIPVQNKTPVISTPRMANTRISVCSAIALRQERAQRRREQKGSTAR